jgi:hypothetical protein
MNNPINLIDPNGKDGIRVIDDKNMTITIKAVYYVQTEKSTCFTTGGNEGIMKYPPKEPNQADANNIGNGSFLPIVILNKDGQN